MAIEFEEGMREMFPRLAVSVRREGKTGRDDETFRRARLEKDSTAARQASGLARAEQARKAVISLVRAEVCPLSQSRKKLPPSRLDQCVEAQLDGASFVYKRTKP